MKYIPSPQVPCKPCAPPRPSLTLPLKTATEMAPLSAKNYCRGGPRSVLSTGPDQLGQSSGPTEKIEDQNKQRWQESKAGSGELPATQLFTPLTQGSRRQDIWQDQSPGISGSLSVRFTTEWQMQHLTTYLGGKCQVPIPTLQAPRLWHHPGWGTKHLHPNIKTSRQSLDPNRAPTLGSSVMWFQLLGHPMFSTHMNTQTHQPTYN